MTSKKHVYRASRTLPGVAVGATFEAAPDDPRVLSGYAELVTKAEAPAEVAEALKAASEGDDKATPAHKGKKG